MLIKTLLATAILSTSIPSFAGVCKMHVVRQACPGKDAESFAKCAGKAECDMTKKADTAEACAKIALDECSNSRLDITKSKAVTAKFDNKDIDGDGKPASTPFNYCKADRSDFNKCK